MALDATVTTPTAPDPDPVKVVNPIPEKVPSVNPIPVFATISTVPDPDVLIFPPDENTLPVFVPCVTSAPEVNDIVVSPIPMVSLFEKAVTGLVF